MWMRCSCGWFLLSREIALRGMEEGPWMKRDLEEAEGVERVPWMEEGQGEGCSRGKKQGGLA